MPSAIALIRGINVGGKHRLPMPALRALCEGLGWQDVATLIQSGNIAFRAPQRALASAAASLESAIERSHAFRPGVIVRSLPDFHAALAASPFAAIRALNPSHLLVMFLAAEPDAAARRALAALKPDPERLALVGREIHLAYPNGIGTSKFPFTLVEKAVNVPGTCRNWNTLSKLLAMAEALEA